MTDMVLIGFKIKSLVARRAEEIHMSADTENSSNSMDVQDAEMSPVVEKATAGNAVVSDDSGKKRKKSVAEKGLNAAGGGSKKGSGSKKARKSMAGRDEGEDEEEDEEDD